VFGKYLESIGKTSRQGPSEIPACPGKQDSLPY
jgi:hypothetical protein